MFPLFRSNIYVRINLQKRDLWQVAYVFYENRTFERRKWKVRSEKEVSFAKIDFKWAGINTI